MLHQIEAVLPALSRTERRVADWILAHPQRSTRTTLAALAAAAGTSEPTVVRFCRRLGLTGFRELKIRLAEHLSQPASYLHHDVRADDGLGDAVNKVVDRSIESLITLRNAAAAMPVAAAVERLAAARQIVFAGLGASGIVAADARHKFFRLGIPCSAATDAPTILQQAAVAARGDVFVVISQRAHWPELQRAMRLARRNAAELVLITGTAAPPETADAVVLVCACGEDTSVYTPMSSRLAHLVLLDALQVGLALALGAESAERLRRAKRALDPAGGGESTKTLDETGT